MSAEQRFPSGLTVTQAKKDAKKLAKSESIKLHEAQDRIARSNGLNLPWDKALAWLERQPQPLMTFRLPLDPERNEGATHHLIDLYHEAPVILIAGQVGTGKTVLALDLAHQALKASISTHYCTKEGGLSVSPFPGDMGGMQLAHLQRLSPSLFHAHELPCDAAPLEVLDVEIAEGSLVMIDELAFFGRSRTELLDWMTWARHRRCVLVLVGQMVEDVAPSSFKPRESAFTSHIGAAVLGRLDFVRRSEDTPEIVQQLLEVTHTLEYSRGQHADFVALGSTPGWIGFARLPSPDWLTVWPVADHKP